MRTARAALAATVTAILISACTTPEEQAREALAAGEQALERSDRDGAVAQLTKATELDPTLARAWALLADAQLQGEFWNAAREAARRAAQLEPRSAAHQEVIGRASVALEAWADARDALTRALELEPARAALHYELARALERLEARDAALAEYQAALEAGVEPLRTRLALARSALGINDLGEARNLLDEAAALPGEPPDGARAELAELREDLSTREAAAQRAAADVGRPADRQVPLMTLLGSLGSADNGAIADVLSGGDPGDLDAALLGVRDVAVANGGPAGTHGGNGVEGGESRIAAPSGPMGTGVRRIAPQPEAVVTLGAPTVTGGDAQAAAQAMRQQLNRYRTCYEWRLESNPSLAGRLTLRIVADAQGHVASVAVASTTLADPEVERCIVRGVGRISFPASESPRGWTVIVPIDLHAAQP